MMNTILMNVRNLKNQQAFSDLMCISPRILAHLTCVVVQSDRVPIYMQQFIDEAQPAPEGSWVEFVCGMGSHSAIQESLWLDL
jgi:hypothetical protein